MNRILATYDIETPVGLAQAASVLAGEQSTGTFVRLASETDELREKSAATVEKITPTGSSREPSLPCRKRGEIYERGLVTVSWPSGNFGLSLPNLLSTLAGNLFELAELSAIRLIDVDLPADFAIHHPGPQFGAVGTRRIVNDQPGPLIGTIIKPSVGLGPSETADLVQTLVEAGIDFIKDDELQANGPDCPFNERLDAVMRVINAHADKTGKQVLYAVNITDEYDQMWRNLESMQKVGANCAMVCMHSIGLPGLRAVRDRSSVPIHGHRAGWGLLSRSPDIGISFDVMQKLWRLAGADHLHVNGLANKFTESDSVVTESAQSVQRPISRSGGPEHLAMPVYSSGQTIWQIDPARSVLGNDDFIFCAGGGIMSHPDGAGQGVTSLREAAEAARSGIPLEEFAARDSALGKALRTYAKPDILLRKR
ncbi:MAG: ribulose-bisphosphate carboxylase large subunit family protein [Granulosicoccus sp.]